MKKLAGKRIALVGQRKSEELSKLVENLGGIPFLRPAQGTVFLDESNIESDIKSIIEDGFNWMIFTTGIGTDALYNIAEKMGKAKEFIEALGKANIAARGYKTVNVLKKLGITPLVRDDDGSTAGLLRELAAYDLKGCRAALQLHGDPAPKLIGWLVEQGCTYKEILPYKHVPPQPEMMEQLITELLNGDIDAVNFTSTPQARFLMSYAREKGVEQDILKVFSNNVIAVAVGKVTAQALKEEGIERVVIPENERMGSAIVALADYYQGKRKL
ncbi:uroporphyrinogen-III synthase [Peribacillus cavernae]|uniref:Uroporphyrinogen-III synthase n=1 Tax=Peribacillus cavernae TaxID=1674310 RepID=A0A433HJM0_9BACI|nr:uroporphyrinogen-III synthase [Peribacillus cavernae]MDQ0219188.1 uroporphyrinogen-III synthase [Peribacillus cavernae]RUQ28590.1 uroporphyrinogen-III synthase [Peribacillus cavernae]